MVSTKSYFFCGIGGSGMLPLALIVRAQGHAVEGSDRSLDQGRLAPKFAFLQGRGIAIHPQDGSGITRPEQVLVTSTAVEDTVPDVVAAARVGAARLYRAELLAQLFNAAPRSIAVAGTSGKSTTTGMIGWILHRAGQDPTVMNGAVMKNFMTADTPFASALVGEAGPFVSEVDESDGSIARYHPKIAVLNNIALDHKSMDELRGLFGDFVAKAETVVLNLDNAEAAALAPQIKGAAITYSLSDPSADLRAEHLAPAAGGISFDAVERSSGKRVHIALPVPGAHNVANALAALGAARASGVPLETAADALSGFSGIRRRLEVVGEAAGVTVIDDFAHNPDKIAATLATLHAFPGRLLILFQPHGYGPLRLMKDDLIEAFTRDLAEDDLLVLCEPVYFGGTTDKSVGSADIVAGVAARGRGAEVIADRAAAGRSLVERARAGDRIVIMGARDDTLSDFAADLLAQLARAAL